MVASFFLLLLSLSTSLHGSSFFVFLFFLFVCFFFLSVFLGLLSSPPTAAAASHPPPFFLFLWVLFSLRFALPCLVFFVFWRVGSSLNAQQRCLDAQLLGLFPQLPGVGAGQPLPHGGVVLHRRRADALVCRLWLAVFDRHQQVVRRA